MRLDTEYRLSDDPAEQKVQLEKALRKISESTNGVIKEFTPTVYGKTTPGTLTYIDQEGWYLRQGQIVDYWFYVSWKFGAGGGAGNLQMSLPSKTWMSEENIWVGSVMSNDITYTNAAHTYCVPIAIKDSYDCEFVSGTHNSTRTFVQFQALGGFNGHIRYIGQAGA